MFLLLFRRIKSGTKAEDGFHWIHIMRTGMGILNGSIKTIKATDFMEQRQ